MTATKKQMTEKAKELLKLFKLDNYVTEQLNKGKHCKCMGQFGGIYDCNSAEEKLIAKVESEHDCVVAVMSYNVTDFGKMYSMMIVSKYIEDWDYMAEDAKDGLAFCWVENLDIPEYSEMGTCCFESRYGGIVRMG